MEKWQADGILVETDCLWWKKNVSIRGMACGSLAIPDMVHGQQPHKGFCWEGRIAGPTMALQNQNLHFNLRTI